MKKKMTIPEILECKKNGTKLTWSIAYDYTVASIIEESEISSILVGDSLGNVIMGYPTTLPVTVDDMIHHIKAVVKGAPNTFIIGDMPFGSYNVSCEQAVMNASRLMKEGGCDAIKLEGGANMADRVEAIVKAGIPVTGHIGLTPQSVSALGGLKLQGKSVEAADRLVADAVALEKAGAFCLCLECIPSVVAKRITETVSIPTYGCGAGPYCDFQQLNFYDITGMTAGNFKAKFVKHFAEIKPLIVEALNAFHEENVNGTFPSPEYSYNTSVEGYE